MKEIKIDYKPIGIIYTPYKNIKDMPIQPSGASGVSGKLVLDPQYSTALQDLDGFSHIYLLYHFHKVADSQLIVTPFLDSRPHGVFATRAPKRPNPIGLSVVKLMSIDNNILILENVDILDGTPVLDIKPYVPAFDKPGDVQVGWLAGCSDDVKSKRSDERFI
jgi:tRNA-Thr(GGU) m(6)t(6)A37 methyltransferase TsaA